MPDIPKLSAGKGLSSFTMNSSTRHRHSSREVLCRQMEAASRESRHSKDAVPSPSKSLLVPMLGSSFWLHVWEFLMASRLRGPCVSLRLSLLECFTCLCLHPYWSASPGFDFCGAKVVKGADDKIPLLYFACFLPTGFPFSLITRRKPGIPEESTKLFGHTLFIFHS